MAKTLTTPAGIASYPWITEPDTRYNPDGHYSVNLVVPEEQAQPLVNAINNEWTEFIGQFKGPKAKKQPASLGYDNQYDDEGNETGNIVFKAKMKHIIRYKDKETGEDKIIEKKLPIFDAEGLAIHPTSVWGGSKLACNITIKGYEAGANLGVSLYLNAVQIIELVAGGSNTSNQEVSAETFGFAPTTGYVAPKVIPKATVAEEADEYDF